MWINLHITEPFVTCTQTEDKMNTLRYYSLLFTHSAIINFHKKEKWFLFYDNDEFVQCSCSSLYAYVSHLPSSALLSVLRSFWSVLRSFWWSVSSEIRLCILLGISLASKEDQNIGHRKDKGRWTEDGNN